MSKQAMQGTASSSSWAKWDDKSKSVGPSSYYKSADPFKSKGSLPRLDDDSDYEETVVDFKPSNKNNKKAMNSGRSSNNSSTEKFIEKIFQ